jgi:hypothetical protein
MQQTSFVVVWIYGLKEVPKTPERVPKPLSPKTALCKTLPGRLDVLDVLLSKVEDLLADLEVTLSKIEYVWRVWYILLLSVVETLDSSSRREWLLPSRATPPRMPHTSTWPYGLPL